MGGSILLILLVGAAGHGLMNWPPSRVQNSMDHAGWCQGDHPGKPGQNLTCEWYNQGCSIGCSECIGTKCQTPSSCCSTPMKPTLDPKFRTYDNVGGIFDIFTHNPWRAPGFAPVFSPCGIAGGCTNKTSTNGSCDVPPTGYDQGTDGRTTFPTGIEKVKWPAGSQQEVSWSIEANHGGGYAYRLCPKSARNDETEECFQRHHLKFASDKQWIQYGQTAMPYGKSNRTAIDAVITSEGTNPKGSTWMRNPIPPCRTPTGGGLMSPGCGKPMFTPPLDSPAGPNGIGAGLFGFGINRCEGLEEEGLNRCSEEEYAFWRERFNFNIIDLVEIPVDLSPGSYVLSFRYDCEQTPQIWANCADVEITEAVIV